MSNVWISVSALVAALATVGVVLFDQGISLTALAGLAAVLGLSLLGVVARWPRRLAAARHLGKAGSFGSQRRPSN
jgi:hypothetical protein